MFNGIIQYLGIIYNIKQTRNITTIFVKVSKNFIFNLQIGDSVSNNGCCLTVTNIYHNNIISFDIIKHTLEMTTFKTIKLGDLINLEKSLKINTYIGSHIILGHITDTAYIVRITQHDVYISIWIKLNNIKHMKYIITKGSICIDGVGLTIDQVLKNKFSVNIIPQTLAKTTLYLKRINNSVNVEIDIFIKTIVHITEKFLKNYLYKFFKSI
ncbi:riboflavin synthase subunit alpha [Enterobacteriaceae endosymbiont of Macroplea mutica]|uniref:riboflavin synthase subunit alpha n=1 Tax=Enterobacteriaceae endosymbiont of Macroplea mutica TaxID=2675791 RepID=UPI001448D1B2|nr:riboflavin synthase subunit alpha [Enterobacteriaceae endosymbiont of Macroplea mutica]QJC31149.1 riboflavin synthase subunit alpha [Enterobacteriaceae endosymbiont of Macroplea mutica]